MKKYIEVSKVNYNSLSMDVNKIYEVVDQRKFELGVAVDVIDNDGDIETLTNFDEVEYTLIEL